MSDKELKEIDSHLYQLDREMKAEIEQVKERYRAAKDVYVKRRMKITRNANQKIWNAFIISQLEYVIGAFEAKKREGFDLTTGPQCLSLPNKNIEEIILPGLGLTYWAGLKGEIKHPRQLRPALRDLGITGDDEAMMTVEFSGHQDSPEGMASKIMWGPKVFPIHTALFDTIEYLKEELEKMKDGKIPPLGKTDIFRVGRR